MYHEGLFRLELFVGLKFYEILSKNYTHRHILRIKLQVVVVDIKL